MYVYDVLFIIAIAENFTCPICYQLFKNPKFLPCHHSCCEKCLEKMLQVQSRIVCPECRKEAPVPAGGVKNLPGNFIANTIMGELELKDEVHGRQELQCPKCDEDASIVSYCPECDLSFCSALLRKS